MYFLKKNTLYLLMQFTVMFCSCFYFFVSLNNFLQKYISFIKLCKIKTMKIYFKQQKQIIFEKKFFFEKPNGHKASKKCEILYNIKENDDYYVLKECENIKMYRMKYSYETTQKILYENRPPKNVNEYFKKIFQKNTSKKEFSEVFEKTINKSIKSKNTSNEFDVFKTFEEIFLKVKNFLEQEIFKKDFTNIINNLKNFFTKTCPEKFFFFIKEVEIKF